MTIWEPEFSDSEQRRNNRAGEVANTGPFA